MYENTSTPLHDACWRGLENEVQWLIDTFKYDTFSQSSLHGWTPLHSASYGGHLKLLQLLIHQHGCDPNLSDHNSISILHMASYKGHISIVQYLIYTCHIPPDEPDESNVTALLYAAIGGHSDLVEFFVNCNCNTSQVNFADASISVLACMSGQVALVHKLEELGLFSPNCKSSLDTNILHYTCQSANDNLELFQHLLSRYQLAIDSKDRYGRAPLHTAAMFASSGVVEFIMNTQDNDSLQSLLVADYDKSCLRFASTVFASSKGGNVYCKLISPHDIPIVTVINSTRVKKNINFFKSSQRLNLFSALLRKASTYPNFNINARTKYGTFNSLIHSASQSGNALLVKALEEYNITSSLNSGYPPLVHKAASSGSTTMLNYIISQYNLDANLRDQYIGQTPLMYCCSSGSINAVEYLITCHNSDPNITDNNGMTSLHHSCCNGHIDVTQYLIEVQHCNVNKTDKEGRTLVHHAASSGNFNLVQYLITEQGLSPTAVDKNGLTALHYASRTLNLHLVQELVVSHQLNPHQVAKDGRLPIHDAAQCGAIFILDYFIKSCKCNLNQADDKGQNVFHYSSKNGNSHFIKHVISQYPEFNKLLHAADSMGNLPLHVVCQNGNAHLVPFLIDDMKCDVTATNKRGKTCVSFACSSNNLSLVQLLVQQYKLNPFAGISYEFTELLHKAVENDCIDILEWCKQYSVDIANYRSINSHTLANLAAYKGALKFLKQLISEYQCDVNTSSATGSTSLHLACERGHFSVVLYLTSLPQCNVAATTLNGSTVLHKACMCSESFPILKHLVENHQLDLCAVNDDGMAPIHMACRNGRLDSVQYIIEHSPSLLELPESIHGHTPFLISVMYNQLKVVQYLISKNCNLFASDNKGSMSGHISANNGRLNALKYLVDNNYCDLNTTNHQGHTPLHVAVLANRLKIIEYLLNKSIPSVTVDWLCEVKYSLDSPQDLHTTNLHINVQDKDGNTPLHLACQIGKKKIVSLLVKFCHSNSYFLIANKKGEMPLHLVAAVGSNDAAEALLVSVTGSLHREFFAARDNEGYTVFHTACSNGHLDVFRFFCNIYSEGIHAMDDKQRSLPYAACKGRNTEIVKDLIEKYKLDPELKDVDGTSCLHLLAGRGHVEIYRYLKQYVHSTAIPYNKIGRTPLHYACSSGRMNMAIYLIETYSCSPDDPDYNDYTACSSCSM